MVCLVLPINRPMKMMASRCQERNAMTSYEIADYAKILPEDQRDRFARFARSKDYEQVRNFVRYQLQMRHRGFTPKAAPGRW